jgi:hypothetical protein
MRSKHAKLARFLANSCKPANFGQKCIISVPKNGPDSLASYRFASTVAYREN